MTLKSRQSSNRTPQSTRKRATGSSTYAAAGSRPNFGSRTALQAVSDGVIVLNREGRVEFLNPAAEALSGWMMADAAMKPVDTIVRLRDAASGIQVSGLGQLPDATPARSPNDTLPDPSTQANVEGVAHTVDSTPGSRDIGQCTLTTRTGALKSITANVSPVCDQDGTISGQVLVLVDRSETTGLQARLDHQSTHDALTGVLNRAEFERALHDVFARTGPRAEYHALLYLDLDQFKVINDTCGHAAGDQYLLQLTRLLRQRVRDSDVLARLGGDEFGILLYGCDESHARQLASELCESVAAMNFTWRGRVHRHTMSIGICSLKADDDPAAALSAADVACFTAKDTGRNRVHVYHDDSVPSRHAEMQWVARISRALEDDRLVLFSQPIVPIRSLASGVDKTSGEHAPDSVGSLDGRDQPEQDIPHYELLVRLTDRFGQVILPRYFISAAERYNLMPRVDRWVVTHVLEHLVWRSTAEPLPRYKLSLNLSGTSLSDEGFLRHLEALLSENPLEPGALCFEITETATISNMGQVAAFMHRMKALGCEFSLDDFGSGLSSFAYLKELPVDLLKIDGDFVADVLTSRSDAAVVDAIVRVSKAMGIRTVAERVESQELLDALTEIGVDFAQGFLFAQPRRVRNRSSFNGVLANPNSALA